MFERQEEVVKTEVARVWNPNTQSSQEYLITQIVRAPDTFSYGQIVEDGKRIRVYYSPFQHRWSR